MAISADQSAVLEMLLTGGQSFEDLDDLFGLEEGDARERARAALKEVGGADPDRNVGLTEYLLGQADPIGRADAVRHLRQDPSDHELAQKIVLELRKLFPAAELPKLPQASGGGRFGGRASATPAQPAGWPKARTSSRTPLSSKQSRLFAAMGAGAVILIAVVLAIAGVFSGDEGTTTSLPETEETATAPVDPTDPSTPIPDGEEISRVALAPPDGGKAGGAAVVGIAAESQPYLDLVLSNLPDPPKGQTYLAWFMFDENNGYPMTEPIIPEKGTYENRIAIPLEIAEPIAQAVAIEISLTDPREIVKAVEDAAAAGVLEIERPGETVLQGDVPRDPVAAEEQQAPGEGGGG